MATEQQLAPDVTITKGRACTVFEFTVPHGRMMNIWWHRSNDYVIGKLDVEPYTERLQGIGKGLLRIACEHAASIGAKQMTADIVSRECLDAMRSVFGEEAVVVDLEGGYAPRGKDENVNCPTRARLVKQLC